MAINPDNITTIRVDQLAESGLTLDSKFPHTVGTELTASTIEDLVALVSSTIETGVGVGFLPLAVTDGQQLPSLPEDPSFFLAGAGTYLNINGYPDLICTENLNAIMTVTDHWEIAVEIPIAPLSGTVQSVTGSAVDNTDPLNPVINSIGAVSSVNGQTGAVSIDLESVLTEGGTATDLDINLSYTGSDYRMMINGDQLLSSDIATNESVSIIPPFIAVNGISNNLIIKSDRLEFFGGGFQSDITFTDPTANRVITFKDESGTVAYLSDIPTVDATPTDGSANAVSSNGVFDALALKANLDRVEQYVISKPVGSYGSVTGTVAETVILSIPFSGGDFEIGDYMGFNVWVTKVGTAGSTNIIARVGTTGTTADSILALLGGHPTGQNSYSATRFYIQFESGNFINNRTRPNSTSSILDITTSVTTTRQSLNPSASWYLTFTVTNVSATDVTTISAYQVTKRKSF